jgi:hypothetical protein
VNPVKIDEPDDDVCRHSGRDCFIPLERKAPVLPPAEILER